MQWWDNWHKLTYCVRKTANVLSWKHEKYTIELFTFLKAQYNSHMINPCQLPWDIIYTFLTVQVPCMTLDYVLEYTGIYKGTGNTW